MFDKLVQFLYRCVRVRVCAFVCMCVCARARLHVCMSMCTFVCARGMSSHKACWPTMTSGYDKRTLSNTCRVENFMDESVHNVIAVHCKGGKGRTGVFVCAWLRYSLFRDSCLDSMEYFASRRSGPKAKHTQGVTGASQRRYLTYFDKALSAGGYRANKLRLLKIRLITCPHMDSDGSCDPWVTLEQVCAHSFSLSLCLVLFTWCCV